MFRKVVWQIFLLFAGMLAFSGCTPANKKPSILVTVSDISGSQPKIARERNAGTIMVVADALGKRTSCTATLYRIYQATVDTIWDFRPIKDGDSIAPTLQKDVVLKVLPPEKAKGTQYAPVLKKILGVCKANPTSPVFVVFSSDGGGEDLAAIQSVSKELAEQPNFGGMLLGDIPNQPNLRRILKEKAFATLVDAKKIVITTSPERANALEEFLALIERGTK